MSFQVLPAVIEVPLECFKYWIIVVSVVAGLLALLLLISLLACVSQIAIEPVAHSNSVCLTYLGLVL